MYQRIAHVALVVESYDDAIEFYTQKLDFQVLEDTMLSEEKRWVMIAPYGTVAVFEDLYGNMWDLIEPNENNKGLINE